MSATVRQAAGQDREWMKEVFEREWGADLIVAKKHCYTSAEVDGFLAEDAGKRIGLITFFRHGDEVEIVSLNSFEEKKGVGSAMIEAVVNWGRTHGARKVTVITSNDNLFVLGFYQRRDFHLVHVYPDAITETRKRYKPGIPLIGDNKIPLRDEIEFARVLS